MSITWHLLTGEYPPGGGGVGDYTAALAHALAVAGDEVHVWTPARGEPDPHPGVTMHRLPDAFGPASRGEMDREWSQRPGVVLLEYVPNALGSRGANLPFCLWFSRLRRRVPDVRVMLHEPYFYFTWTRPWAVTNALAAVQRIMARLLVRGATRLYLSTDTWRRYLPRVDRSIRVQTLPIPSSIPVAASDADIAAVRQTVTDGRDGAAVIGHFGTYGAHVAGQLTSLLPALIARLPEARLALLGAGGPEFLSAIARSDPAVARAAWAPGRLDAPSVASALRACDVLVQPYPDGVTTRRTSVMAGLKNGVATVSTAGALTEPVWTETAAIALAAVGDDAAFVETVAALLRDPREREALGRRAAASYAAKFSLDHTVAILRDARAS